MYNTVSGQVRDVGEPRTVRLFYLLPNDRPYRQEVVDAMKAGILELQSFFTEQMATHGYGNMTFQIETDAQGAPVVHRVDGDHANKWYVNHRRTDGEIERAFDSSKNIILIVLDSTGASISGTGAGDKINGWAMIFGGWTWAAAAHELGHAFGLHHDLRDKADILGYGRPQRLSAKLSAGAAGWLSVHPYFNTTIPLRGGSKPTLEFISETKYPLGAESVPIRVRVRDDDGLHQVLLLTPIRGLLGVSKGVKEYRKMSGETDTIVEFSYDGLPPIDNRWYGAHRTSLSNPMQHPISFRVVDTEGNSYGHVAGVSEFVLEAVQPSMTPVSERTPQVRDAIVAAAGVNSATDVTEAHLAAITDLFFLGEGITTLKSGDFDGLTALTSLHLGDNRLSSLPEGIFDELTELERLILYGNRLSSLPEGIFDELTELERLILSENQLNSLPEGIFDELTELEWLHLSENQLNSLPDGVFDELTELDDLDLGNNQLSSLPEGIFDGLTALTELDLSSNVIAPFPLTVSLQKVAGGQFKAVAPTGAPFDIMLPLTVTNGNISGGASTVTIPIGSVESGLLTVTRTLGTNAPVTVNIGTLPAIPTPRHNGYALVKSTDLPLEVITAQANRAPVFTDGTTTIRTIAENTAAGVNIGAAIAATDPDTGDTLTYTLSGTDAAAFRIDSTTGQLQTQAALDYETKRTYTVTVSVSDGSLTDTIAVTISVTNVDEKPARDLAGAKDPEPTNNVPVFTEGVSATRTIAENTAASVNIGAAIAATDPDTGDTLTYTLSGTDAAAFRIDSTTGQLQTQAALDYETKRTYTVTLTVSDGSLTDIITVTINVTDINELPPTTGTGNEPEQPDTPEQPGDQDAREQPIVTTGAPTLSVSTAAPLTEATLHGGIITLNLSGGTFESKFAIKAAITLSGIAGVTLDTFGVDRISDAQATIALEYDGNMTVNGTLTVSVGARGIKDYEGAALTSQISVRAVTESITASTAVPLGEAILDESVVTLTLTGRKYASAIRHISNSVSVSGISGVTVDSFFDTRRESDTEVSVELTFNGNMNTDGTLTFTVGADAIAEYNGSALTAQVSVSAGDAPIDTSVTPTLTASTVVPLTAAKLDGSYIRLTLSGRIYESALKIREAVSVSGIPGVTVRPERIRCSTTLIFFTNCGTVYGINRANNPEVTVALAFEGDMNADGTLTFTVGADAIAGYNGPALTAQVSVSAGDAPAETGGQNSDPPETPEPPGDTAGQTPDPPEPPEQTGDEVPPEQPVNTRGIPTLSVSTMAPFTEATLHGGVITLNLTGGTFERSSFSIRNAITLSGITGVTLESFGGKRISDTQATIALEYEGNMTVNGPLTISVGAGAIVDYTGATLTAQIPVTANTESVVASAASQLTEATLDGGVVTLTLNNAKYARSIFDIRDAVSVSGINGVTKPWNQPKRENDTEVTIKLEFDGTDFDSTGALTFTVEADAIAGYNGPALTASITATGLAESVVASTVSPLKEATLDGSVVTLTLNGAKYARSIWDIRDGVTVSGISGVTIPRNQPDRESNTQITIELEFDGTMNTDGTLTFTVGADAIANYNGSALTTQVSVTANRKNALLANFPNPFNPETWIPYHLSKDADVTLTIYASNGQVVRRLALGYQPAGIYQSRSRAAYWDGRNAVGEPVASGVYFYTLTAGDFTATRKMLIRK